MIEIGGIDFLEPSDLATVSYNGALYYRIDNPATEQSYLMLCSALDAIYADVAHNDHGTDLLHAGVVEKLHFATNSYFGREGHTGIQIFPATDYTYLRGDGGINLITLTPSGGYKTITFVGAQYVQTANAGYNQYMIANGFITWGCRAADKDNIESIKTPDDKLAKLNGITFNQNNTKRTGITKEDLESIDIPGLVEYDPDGQFRGVCLTNLIPLLVEEVKALRAELNVLKGELK